MDDHRELPHVFADARHGMSAWWHAAQCLWLSGAVLSAACGSGDRQSVRSPQPTTGPQTFLGCIGPTNLPDRFILSVAEGRNATYGAPPRTPVPEPGPPPPASHPRRQPPLGSVGLPGDGPDPITKIVTYNLVGEGGLDMNAHVGHTVEIVGDVQEIPEVERAAGKGSEFVRQLHVTTARHVADHCLGDPR
jgi:hypothetical protein